MSFVMQIGRVEAREDTEFLVYSPGSLLLVMQIEGLRLARTQVFLFIGHAALMLLVQNGRVDARKDTDLFVYRET